MDPIASLRIPSASTPPACSARHGHMCGVVVSIRPTVGIGEGMRSATSRFGDPRVAAGDFVIGSGGRELPENRVAYRMSADVMAAPGDLADLLASQHRARQP